jgi:hypothetical protein
MRSSWVISGFALSIALAAAAASEAEEKKKEAAKTPSEIELAVWKSVMASAPLIDKCTESYLVEYPEANGKADLATTVVKDGSVSKVQVSTGLDGARNLVPCLEKAGKTWRFPKLNEKTESVELNLAVVVKKGTKFQMKKPGEKEPEKKPDPKSGSEAEDFIHFVPDAWVESPQ